jgi:hypothetical protein
MICFSQSVVVLVFKLCESSGTTYVLRTKLKSGIVCDYVIC